MKIDILFFLFILIINSGCKSNKARSLEIFDNIVPEHFEKNVQNMTLNDSSVMFISIKDCSIRKEALLSEWVDSISFVYLNSDNAALIGSINKLVQNKDAIYLLDRYKTKSIKKFAMNGEYLTDIGKYGEGPGEYVEPTDFIVNDSSIIVYDQFGCRLNFYTLDGKYICAKKMPFLCLRFHQFTSNNFIFCTLDADNQHMQAIEDYSIFETDSAFIINKRGFYRKRGLYSSIISDFNFAEMNGQLYYHPPFSGKIYKINPDGTCEMVVQLDFGLKRLPEKFLLNENWNEFQEESDKGRYYFFPGEFLFAGNTIYFSYINQHKMYRCFYSMKNKTFVGSSCIKNDIYPIFPFANLLGVDDDCVVGYVYPHSIVEARSNYSSEEWVKLVGEASAKISMNCKEEDNPILIWYHLKREW